MQLITCATCGVPLGPETAYKCSECGRLVCREHITYAPPSMKKVCRTCFNAKLRKKEERALSRQELEIALIQF